jgi:bifunctional non-homologous end joining protein LigD
VGSLVLGYFERGRFVYAGRVGTGFNRRSAGALWTALQPLRTPSSPYAALLDSAQRQGVTWVKPEMVVQIEYRARTADNLLRHASFKGIREDKTASSVRDPKPPASRSKDSGN